MSIKQNSILNHIFTNLKPKPKLNGLDWVKLNGYLSAENSAITGRFKPYKYQEAWLLSATDEDVVEDWYLKSARVGYTKVLNFSIAYHISESPCSQLMFNPNDKKANEWSKKELKPLLRDMPIVGDKIIKTRQDDTVNFKAYPGGIFESRGGVSASNYAAATAKRVNFDEYDRFPDDVDGEGSPEELGKKRTATFWDNKAIFGSTPTIKGHSKTENGFKNTDMCYFFVPCPHCKKKQRIEFKNIIWDKEYRDGVLTHLYHTTHLKCIYCEEKIDHKYKKQITEDDDAEWRQTQKFYCCEEWQDPIKNNNWDNVDYSKNKYIAEALCKHCNTTAEYNRVDRKKRGFHIWAGYSSSPDADWKDIARIFVEAKDSDNPSKLKAFKNIWLAETYEEKTLKLDNEDLLSKRLDYEKIPNDVQVVLMTVDTQDDRLEYLIKSWHVGETSYSLKAGKIMGDPINNHVWNELRKIADTPLLTEDGREVYIFRGFIDMAGHKTDEVKNFIKKNDDKFTMLKGDSHEIKQNDNRPIGLLKKPANSDYPILWVATTKAKDMVFQRLSLKNGEYGKIYYNKSFDEEWFNQLTAEKKIFKLNKKGYVEETYIKTRDRNEALDLEVYQIAAIKVIQDQIEALDLSIQE